MENIPVLTVTDDTIAGAWEGSLIRLFEYGIEFETQYDRPGDPKSLDCTMNLTVLCPMMEPMIHRDFPGGFEDLQEYVMEVCDGIKDHWVRDPSNPDDKRWEYTYHQRLFAYEHVETVPAHEGNGEWESEGHRIAFVNQFEAVCRKLVKQPFTRQAQMITWQPWNDMDCDDPACLQSIWFRILDDDGVGWLNTNVRIRSNDAYKAAFMNIFAFVMLAQKVADRVSELSGREVKLGRYNHHADSYHVYGKDLKEFRDRFLKSQKTRTFPERTFEYEGMAKEIMLEAVPKILQKVKTQDEKD